MSSTAEGVACARIGLLGNPGDGYDGKALAVTIRNFRARARVADHPAFALNAGGIPITSADIADWDAPDYVPAGNDLERLACAAVRRFYLFIAEGEHHVPNLAIDIDTNIPREVGLAGSSAVIIATLRALCRRHGVQISAFDLAEHALATELEDLGIACGAMDRVIQSYEGAMAMELKAPRRASGYKRVGPDRFPQFVVGWDPHGSKPSGLSHGNLRRRWLDQDPEVMNVISELRGLVDRGMAALETGDHRALGELMNRNFDLRCSIFDVADRDREMVRRVREEDGAAKLCGSGGAIVVLPTQPERVEVYEHLFDQHGWHTFRPVIG